MLDFSFKLIANAIEYSIEYIVNIYNKQQFWSFAKCYCTGVANFRLQF